LPLIIASTADDLSGVPTSITLNGLEIENGVFSESSAIYGCHAHLSSEFSPKLPDIDQNNLRMKLN